MGMGGIGGGIGMGLPASRAARAQLPCSDYATSGPRQVADDVNSRYRAQIRE